MMQKQPLLNTAVNNMSRKEAVDEAERCIHAKEREFIFELNADVIMKIEHDDYLKRIADEAEIVLVDGKPVVWISKLTKYPVKEKVSGSDLAVDLCEMAEKNGFSVFILGGKEGVAEMAKNNLLKRLPKLNVAGTYSPPFGFEKDAQELKRIRRMISDASPDILLVCFGCPKQEKWIYENYRKIDAKIFLCAGATVDFLAGTAKRCPKWMSNCGLEWFFRFLQEPRRMFKRYFIDDIQILGLVFKYRNNK